MIDSVSVIMTDYNYKVRTVRFTLNGRLCDVTALLALKNAPNSKLILNSLQNIEIKIIEQSAVNNWQLTLCLPLAAA